ncbi:MAG: mechanosensitive ion channel family protein, partial [Candidatus Omnitrophota bacterium]
KVILKKIKKIVMKTTWKGDEIIIGSLHGWIILWFVLAGIYGTILSLPVSQTLLGLIKNVLLVLAILSVTIVLAKICGGFINIYQEKVKGVLPTATLFSNLTRLFIFLIGILIILQSLGISISPILTGLGIGGLAVALALQDTLSNLFAGLHIILSSQIRPGDYVKLDSGEEGYVTDITWRSTTIRQLSNNIVVIPNSRLASAIVTNYHLSGKDLSVLVQVGVSYNSDLEKVEKVTIEVAKEVMREVPGGVPEFEPFIRYHTFADFSINFTVILRAKEFVDQYLIKHEFIKRLYKRYKEERIVIPFPIRTVYLENSEKK